MTSSQSTTSRVASVLAGLNQVRGWQEDVYRDLHKFPELSHEERHTAERVAYGRRRTTSTSTSAAPASSAS